MGLSMGENHGSHLMAMKSKLDKYLN